MNKTQNSLSGMRNQSPGNVMTIHGRSGILESSGLIALGVLTFCFNFRNMPFFKHIVFFFDGALLVSWGLLLLWRSIPRIGKPLLVLSPAGFEAPWFGFTPWTAVKTIYKQDVTFRGIINFSPILAFIIADPKPSERQFQILSRPYAGIRTIRVVLRHCKMKPDDVLSAANQLWAECTGHAHSWNSANSSEVSDEELKKLESLSSELSDLKLRQEALRAIAELRSYKPNPDGPHEISFKQGRQTPMLEEPYLSEEFRLYGDLKSSEPEVQKQAMDKIRLRRIEKDKLIIETRERMSNPAYCINVKNEFSRRQSLLRCIVLSMLALFIFFMVIAAKCGMPMQVLFILLLGFYLSYFYVASRIWRCPACNLKFDLGYSSNLKSCPHCKVLFGGNKMGPSP